MSTNNKCCVLSRFERKRKDGTILKLRIQHAPSELLGDVLEFNMKYFTADETFQRTAGILSNPEAMLEFRTVVKEEAKKWSFVICCRDNDSNSVEEILGVSAVVLVTGDVEEDFKFQTKEMQTLFNILMETEELSKSLKKEFGVYYEGRGIIVHPQYRGLGIASEFIKLRRLLINDQNVKVTCAWMTSYGSQKAAERDNWETVLEVTAEELGQRCGVVFKDPPSTFKLMLARSS
ncbi:uncharacterized protein [Battus philenor]|uniref:uncharacterized protein n=1 Tax=Battus philenor TaxID=42288 RepID=UPI0035D0690F